MTQNDFYKKLLEECIRCDAAMELAKDELSRIKEELSEEAVPVVALVEVLSKLPQWVEALRGVVVQEVVASFDVAVKRYLEGARACITSFADMEDSAQTAFVSDLSSLTKAFQAVQPLERKTLVPSLAALRTSAGESLERAQHAMKAGVLGKAISFLEGQDYTEYEGEDECEEIFVSTLNRDDLENFDLPEDLAEKLHLAAVTLLMRILVWTGEEEASKEEASHISGLLNAVSKLHRMIGPKVDAQLQSFRALLLKWVSNPMELMKAKLEVGTPEDLAKKTHTQVVAAVTQFKSFKLRCEEDLAENGEAITDEDEATAKEARSRVGGALEQAETWLETTKQVVTKKLETEMKSTLAESTKMFGTLEARKKSGAGLWAHHLPPNANWTAVVAAANETLLKEDYVKRLSQFVKAAQKDPWRKK